MMETTKFMIGAPVFCQEESCGTVIKMVLEPVSDEITHIVVEPEHRSGLGRLVPLHCVDVVENEVRLRCTRAEFDRLRLAEDTEFLPANQGGYGGYGPGQMAVLPHYRLSDASVAGSSFKDLGNAFQPLVTDNVPNGEVEIHRGETLQATDGGIGIVAGLVMDPVSHRITHVLLQDGHLWGKRQITIPLAAVTRIDDEIRLDLTKDEVRDLPEVGIIPPGR